LLDIDLFLKSSILAIVLTIVPIIILVFLWEFNLLKSSILILWLLFTLLWQMLVIMIFYKKNKK